MKTDILWFKYDINWFGMADKSCKKCYGRGYQGYETDSNGEKIKLLCDCVADKWSKMTDEERLKFATLKPNADELEKQAKEEVKKLIEKVVKK